MDAAAWCGNKPFAVYERADNKGLPRLQASTAGLEYCVHTILFGWPDSQVDAARQASVGASAHGMCCRPLAVRRASERYALAGCRSSKPAHVLANARLAHTWDGIASVPWRASGPVHGIR